MKAKILLSPLIAAIAIATAQTETKATTEAEIQKIISTHEEAMTAFMKEVRDLPREKQRDFYQANYPKPDATREALDKVIDANPKDPAILSGVSWIARFTRGAGLDESDFANLTANHLDHEKLAEVVLSLAYSREPAAASFLQTVSEKSKTKGVRGAALYARSIGLKGKKDRAAEHKALIDRLVSEHPDLTVRGRKIIDSLISERDAAIKFAIGKTAPEIIGKDVDGNEMKLSDYQGKVVVLDFWGDW